jgi:hypothetical protein
MTRFYRTAVLLIEFDEGRPFGLQVSFSVCRGGASPLMGAVE